MKKWKIGISVNWGKNFDEKISAVEKAGLDSVDFDLCRYWQEREKEIELYKDFEKGLECLKRSNLYFNGVHVSFGSCWDFSAIDEAERKRVILQTKEIFQRCDSYQPFCYILHGSKEPVADHERAKKLEQLKKTLHELRAFTNSKICVETLPRSCLCNSSKEMIDVVDSVGGIDVCMDVNHIITERAEELIERLGARIQTTHISDFDYVNERHWLPGEGKIDWQAVISAFEKIGYKGVWNYEVNLACPKTILRDRDFTYEDFARNADELFNKKPITVISKHKEKLGMWE